MSCARRANCPGRMRDPCAEFNPLIPPHHNCFDEIFKKEKQGDEQNTEPVCTWSRNPEECVQFDCFGDFDMKRYRPKCDDVLELPRKTRPTWCSNILPGLIPECNNPCPGSVFECKEPEPEYPEKQPWRRMPCCRPQFLWDHGYATVNLYNVPYPEHREGLKFKEKKVEDLQKTDAGDGKNKSNAETELWSLTCMPSDARPPLWKTEGLRTPWCCRPVAPLYFWKDGRPRPNDLRLPYPGHGFKLFDSCQHRREFPPQSLARNVNGVFAPPKTTCNKSPCF